MNGEAIKASLEELYRAFAVERSPVCFDAPVHRRPVQLLRSLTAKPLQTLNADDLGAYGSWAMTTVGSVADYRYFLPRILELSLTPAAWDGLSAC